MLNWGNAIDDGKNSLMDAPVGKHGHKSANTPSVFGAGR
jgi:hypothetical protein